MSTVKLYHATTPEKAEKIINNGFKTIEAYFCPHPTLYSEISPEGGSTIIEYGYNPDTDRLYNEESSEVLENIEKVKRKIEGIASGDYVPKLDDKFEVVLVSEYIDISKLKIINK
jgi:hypothetical protein